MKKKKLAKYQVAGQTIKNKNVYVPKNTYATSGEEVSALSEDLLDQSMSYNPNLENLQPTNKKSFWDKFSNSDVPQKTELHPYVKGFNALARITTGIASKVNDIKANKNERRQYLDSLIPTQWENMERYSLNTNPVFTKFGGKTAYQVGGNTILPKNYKERWNNFLQHAVNIQKINPKDPSLNSKSTTSKMIKAYNNENPNEVINEEWIPLIQEEFDIENNFNKDFAKRKGLDKGFKKEVSPYDGIIGPKTIGQKYALVETKKPIDNQLQTDSIKFLDVNKKQKMPENAFLASDGKYYHQDASGNVVPIKMQKGGLIKVKGTNKNVANIEGEKGEVVEDFSGDISQINPDGKTHEEGGEFIPNVHRVLENTSDLRTDKNSKFLKLDRNAVRDLTGIDIKSSMSHAKALVKADQIYEDKRNKITDKINLASKNKKVIDKYSENSIKLNMDQFQNIPTREMLFENLFNHQESVKNSLGISNPENSKYGGITKAQLGAYKGNKSGKKTPAGNSDAYVGDFNLALEDLKKKGFNYENITNPAEFQSALYEYQLKNDPDAIRKMWSEGMHQKGMSKAKQLGFIDEKGLFKPGVLDKEENLSKLKELYADGILGRRTMQLTKGSAVPKIWSDDDVINPEAPVTPEKQRLDTSINNNTDLTKQPESKFNEPLRWFDVASPLNAYLAAMERIPEKYNPAEFNQLRYKLQDPTAQLQQNQSDFNSAQKAIQDTGSNNVGSQMANIANLVSRKYLANTQVIGNTENQNAQIKNSEILYNTQVRDKQSVANQQAREIFEEKVLTGKAKQQEQKLTALDSLYKTFAENRALNRNGNLIMKFARAYDQYGDYNGYNTKFSVNPSLGLNPPQPNTQPAGGIQNLQQGKTYYNRKTGKVLRFDGVNLVEVK
jgi:hypothetical protein